MSKLERLLNLTAALLDSEVPLRADQIQQRVSGYPTDNSAYRRMFERDKADLREMNVPLKVVSDPDTDPPIDAYLINRDDYVGTGPSFDPDELAALHLATNLVRLDGAEEGVAKLGGGVATTDAQTGLIPFDDLLADLVSAAASGRAITFTYSNVERTVEPWRLSFAKGHWYLSGWDRLRDDDRLYRVDRINDGVADAGEALHPISRMSDPGSLRGWELGDGDPTTATVRIDADHATWAHRVFGDSKASPDGSVLISVDVRNVEAFRSAVITFLDHAEILSPDHIRDDMIEWLTAQS